MKQKQLKRLQVQEDRLKEFSHQENDSYEERKIGMEWWVKNYNGGTGRWQVSIYSEQSYQRYKSYQDKDIEFEYAINKDD